MYRDADADRSILVTAADGEICGYHRASGAVVWKHEVHAPNLFGEGRVYGSIELAIDRGRVYAVTRDRILCVDYLTGAPIGQVQLPETTSRPTLLVDGDHVFVGTREAVTCYSHDGKPLWSATRSSVGGAGPALGVPGNVQQTDDDHR